MTDWTPSSRWAALQEAAATRILVLDGAMGTQIQTLGLQESDYGGGGEFANWSVPLGGNNDLLSLTLPDAIRGVHDAFIAAGADFLETNTFSSTSIAQADYAMEAIAPRMAEAGARLAREAAEAAPRPVAVLGAIGPTNKTLSLSPRVEDPGHRDVDFDTVRAAYREQAEAMAEHVDAFLIETVFDTLNAKAAIMAVRDVSADAPLLISGTITDASGRTLSGQTPEAFWISVSHAKPWAVGLNCALGAKAMRPHIETLARVSPTRILAYPNAGLPNAFGGYDETPEETAGMLGEWARSGLLNIVGGCCGTTPDHIQAIATVVSGEAPHDRPEEKPGLELSGLEPFQLSAVPMAASAGGSAP